MFWTNNMLLCWTLDSLRLLLGIKPKVVEETLQWRSEWQVQIKSRQSNGADKRIELAMQLLHSC